MPANLENSPVATGLEKVSFHSNPKERQCQRMVKIPHNCTHLTRKLSAEELMLLNCGFGEDSEAGRDWGQEGEGTTEDEMAGWHH